MALTEKITELDSYKQYLTDIGQIPSYQLDKCFSCGLPAVWLYMRSVGLEEVYFDIIKKVKDRSILFKELFYLLLLSNGKNKYFPYIPENMLDLEIPQEFLDAQVPMPSQEFQLAFSFTKEQLISVLEKVALPGELVRFGNKQRAVAIMADDDGSYAVYHAGNPKTIHYNSLDKCVDLIFRVVNGHG